MSGSVNTNLGDPNEDDRNGGNGAWLVPLVAFLAAPLVALSAIATWFTFSYFRVRRSVLALGLLLYVLIAAIFAPKIIGLFIASWTQTLPDIFRQEIPVVGGIFLFILQQAPLSLPLGVGLGLLYSSYRWLTRPVWEEYVFRATPWEIYLRRRNISDIKSDKNGPLNGTTLGITRYGHKIVQTDNEARAHTLTVGASGTGKTTTLMSKARDAIRRGQGLIFVDLKGGQDVPEILSLFAKRYDRSFQHWLMQPRGQEYTGPAEGGPSFYDPLARGEATRRKDLLIASREWGANAEYYKIQASDYLQVLFNVLIKNPNPNVSTLGDTVTLLNPNTLWERAIKGGLGQDPEYAVLMQGIDEMKDTKLSKGKLDAIESLRSQLNTLLQSVAGTWLQTDPKHERDIDLFKAAHEGQIVVFSLDSSNYPELSALVANLIIQDLKTITSELRADPAQKPVQVFIDEFSAIGSDNIVGLVNKSRDAYMPVTLSTQALADLRKVDPAFMDQMLDIINCFIIHRANTEDSAEVYAGLSGKVRRKKFRQSVEHSSALFGLGRGRGSGSGTVEDVEEYRVMPTEVQELNMGEHIYISKSPQRIERVLVIPEDDAMTSNIQRTAFNPTVADIKLGKEATLVHTPALADGVVEEEDEPQARMASPFPTDVERPALNMTKPPVAPERALNLNGGLRKPAVTPKPELPKAQAPEPEPIVAATPAFPSAPRFPKPSTTATSPAQPAPLPEALTKRPVVKAAPKVSPAPTPTLPQEILQPTTPKPPRRRDEFEF